MRWQVRPSLRVALVTAALSVSPPAPALDAQQPPDDAARASQLATAADLAEIVQTFEDFVERQRHEHDVLRRKVDDLMFFLRLSDVAEVQMVTFRSGPPRWPDSDGSLVYPHVVHEQGDVVQVEGLDQL